MGMSAAHEEEMFRIVSRFVAACSAPTRRFRRTASALCLGGAVLIVGAATMSLRLIGPLLFLGLVGISFILLAVSLRLALNDMRDVREQYRRSRRDLFVTTFSDEEFRRKVRDKRSRLQEAESAK
jgi:NhaP-type Na+/H+ or K+/H+ antiporter